MTYRHLCMVVVVSTGLPVHLKILTFTTYCKWINDQIFIFQLYLHFNTDSLWTRIRIFFSVACL